MLVRGTEEVCVGRHQDRAVTRQPAGAHRVRAGVAAHEHVFGAVRERESSENRNDREDADQHPPRNVAEGRRGRAGHPDRRAGEYQTEPEPEDRRRHRAIDVHHEQEKCRSDPGCGEDCGHHRGERKRQRRRPAPDGSGVGLLCAVVGGRDSLMGTQASDTLLWSPSIRRCARGRAVDGETSTSLPIRESSIRLTPTIFVDSRTIECSTSVESIRQSW